MKCIGLVAALACAFLASACGGSKQTSAPPLYVHAHIETLNVSPNNPALYLGARVELLDHTGAVVGTAALQPWATGVTPAPYKEYAADIYSQATSGDDFLVLIDGCTRPAAFSIAGSDRSPGGANAVVGDDGHTYIAPPGEVSALFGSSSTGASCRPLGSDEEVAWAAFKAKWGDPTS